jgi:hypothetical protein
VDIALVAEDKWIWAEGITLALVVDTEETVVAKVKDMDSEVVGTEA